MSKRSRIRSAVAGMASLVLVGPALAVDDPAVLKDLTAVIALQGQPCGQVVAATRQGDKDYIATCQDGKRYRVFVNPQGRVVVQRQ